MVWKSNITTEEANKLIKMMSENVRKGLMSGRVDVESQLFPVSTYICIACHQLYDQEFQFRILKDMVEHGCDPREIGPKCKTIIGALNGLGFQAFAMLYLHGRGQCLYDMGGPDKEPEEKKEQTKFILDFFRNLNPNYRNDRKLLVDQSEDNNMRVFDNSLIEKLRGDMFEPTKEQVKKYKRIVATLTNWNFLDKCECRAGIFEHGPYELDTGEFLLFKEFMFFYTGEEIYAGRKAPFEHSETEATSPIPNLSIGYVLKDMKTIEFNDWGTMFADPPELSNKITSIGLWHRELLRPIEQRYPDKMGEIYNVDFGTLEQVGKYAQDAMTELYMKIADWDYNERLLDGVSLYTNFMAIYSAFAGIELDYDWTVPEKTKNYIPRFKGLPLGVHPWFGRFSRRKKQRKVDPTYYYIIE
ncbi:MAG: hypothetical protein HWN67_10660 [Candidatus Helarchaeota archaeon]|nr:hypothetical protein [Candidatus Helarchaeota archaeon]